MNKKYFLVLIIIQFVFLNARAEKIKIALPVEVQETDPYDLNLMEESEVFTSVHDSLFNHEVLTGFEPVLAQNWEFNKIKKTITFHMKPDLKFSDGSSLTAKDVEFTFKRLILLDTTESLTLTKCLSDKTGFKNIQSTHPLIHVLGKNSIVLGPTKCGESILEEIGDPNYGIVSEKYVGKDLKLMAGAAVSGAFMYKKTNSGFNLVPNLYNWRWKNAQDKKMILDFIKVDQSFASISPKNVDLFRTSDKKVLDEATKNAFEVVISVPIMVWYITSDLKSLPLAQPIFSFLNGNIKKRNYTVFFQNSLEASATSFFPKEFNCDYSQNANVAFQKINKNITVRLINHKSNESVIYIYDLKRELESGGFNVVVDGQKNEVGGTEVTLYLKRQFLGDGTQGSLNYAFRIIKSIPDPDKKITKKLELVDQEQYSEKEKNKLLQQACEQLHFFNHTPLAHRKYAFLYKSFKFRDIFSKGNGNLLYNKLIK